MDRHVVQKLQRDDVVVDSRFLYFVGNAVVKMVVHNLRHTERGLETTQQNNSYILYRVGTKKKVGSFFKLWSHVVVLLFVLWNKLSSHTSIREDANVLIQESLSHVQFLKSQFLFMGLF